MRDGDAKVNGRAIPVTDPAAVARFVGALAQPPPASGVGLFRADLTDASLARSTAPGWSSTPGEQGKRRAGYGVNSELAAAAVGMMSARSGSDGAEQESPVRDRTRLGRIVRGSVTGDPGLGALVEDADLTGLAELAFEHGVAAQVYASLRPLDVADAAALRMLAGASLRTREHTAQVLADLEYLATLLEAAAVPWVVVKGLAVAATLYDPPELRPAGDLDVLVAPADFARAVDALTEAGQPVDDANLLLIRRMLAGQLHFWLPAGTSLDLHWNLLFGRETRRHFVFPTEEMLERRREVALRGVSFATLDPSDTLLHLCFHAADSGGDRLGWLTDIHRSVVVGRPPWSTVVERARAWHMPLAVGTMLLRTRHELGTPVPDPVIEDLLPPAWRTTMRWLDQAFPVAPSTRRWGTPASLLTRAASSRVTSLAAVGHAVGGITQRGRNSLRTGSLQRRDKAQVEEGGHLHDAGGDETDRALYLAEVAARRPPGRSARLTAARVMHAGPRGGPSREGSAPPDGTRVACRPACRTTTAR